MYVGSMASYQVIATHTLQIFSLDKSMFLAARSLCTKRLVVR